MRINKYIASSTELSRRAADDAIAAGRVLVNGQSPQPGQDITDADVVTLDNRPITPAVKTITIMLNKPPGIVVSRDGQGAETIYDLLPPEYRQLNPVGRLDKYSSGLLLLTNDGQLHQELTHPSHQKVKVYEVFLDKPLQPLHQQMISDYGVTLEDGPSRFLVTRLDSPVQKSAGEDRAGSSNAQSHPGRGEPLLKNRGSETYEVQMTEGRNRQIRRTFEALGYRVTHLHRTNFGPYALGSLKPGGLEVIKT